MLLEFIDTIALLGLHISSHTKTTVSHDRVQTVRSNDHIEALDSYFYGEFRDNECNAI